MPSPKKLIPRARWKRRIGRASLGHTLSAASRAKISEAKTGVPRADMVGASNPMRRPEIAAKLRKIDNPSYDTIHSRLESDRGRACDLLCVVCGKPAKDWCLLAGRGTHRGGSHSNVYSLDINDYVTMCRSHHRLYDEGRIEL